MPGYPQKGLTKVSKNDLLWLSEKLFTALTGKYAIWAIIRPLNVDKQAPDDFMFSLYCGCFGVSVKKQILLNILK